MMVNWRQDCTMAELRAECHMRGIRPARSKAATITRLWNDKIVRSALRVLEDSLKRTLPDAA
jgi:hypothetical protein